MIDTPHVFQFAAVHTAALHLTIPRSDIRKVMGPGLKEVMAAVAAQGLAPAGAWLTHHLRLDPGTFDFEICVPVEKPIAPAGRVMPSELRAVRVARTVLHGGYEGLGQAWPKLDAWVRENGLQPRADLWEVYLVGPESGSDPTAWQTELNRPLDA